MLNLFLQLFPRASGMNLDLRQQRDRRERYVSPSGLDLWQFAILWNETTQQSLYRSAGYDASSYHVPAFYHRTAGGYIGVLAVLGKGKGPSSVGLPSAHNLTVRKPHLFRNTTFLSPLSERLPRKGKEIGTTSPSVPNQFRRHYRSEHLCLMTTLPETHGCAGDPAGWGKSTLKCGTRRLNGNGERLVYWSRQ